MAEQPISRTSDAVTPPVRDKSDDAAGPRPVLSRYARRRAAAVAESDVPAETPPAEPSEPAPAGAGADAARSVVGEGIEISPRQRELQIARAADATAKAGTETKHQAAGKPATAEKVEAARESADAEKVEAARESADAENAEAALATNEAEVTGKPQSTDGATRPDRAAARRPAAPPSTEASAKPAPEAAQRRAPAADTGVRRVEADEVEATGSRSAGWSSSALSIRDATSREDHDTRSGRKRPFWKRLALPLVQGAASAARSEPPRPASLEPVLARLGALEKQLAANQAATEGQLARFEANITRLWELEEQLTVTEVRERMALIEANQQEIADGLHTVARNLAWLAVVLAAAVVAGLLALGLLL